MTDERFDLRQLIPPNVTTLNTLAWGIELKNGCGIDDMPIEPYTRINVLLPKQVTAVSTTFLAEFFENTIVKFGEMGESQSEILDKIQLVSDGKYDFHVYLEEAIKQVYRKEIAASAA